MWRVAARIGGVAFGRPLISSLLGSGFAAPALVRASLIVPSLANLQHAEPTSRCRLPNSNLRVALLGLVAGAVLSQPDAAECMPPSKRKAKAPAASSAKKKAGPASAGVDRLFSKAGSMHHDLKGSMEDGSLEHALIATANTE